MAFPKTRFRRALIHWYRLHGRDLSWRRTRDPYAILVSEFMLQQTQVATVIPYYSEWLRRFPDFAVLARTSENDVLRAWQGLGYYTRARNLHATARAVVDRRGGHFPRSIDRMQKLPGIGKYTAHAIASFAFNQSVPILEANTARVLARLFNFRESIDHTAGRKALWKHAASLVPKRSARFYNSALVDLGALVCLPRKPKCTVCPVKEFCRAENPELLPIKKNRPPMMQLTENHTLITRTDRILLQKADSRWRGMWILPPLRTRPVNRPPIYKSIFPFTNHRVAFNVYAQRWPKIDNHSQRWIRIDSLDSIPIATPHRRAMQHLLSDAKAARSRRQQSSGL
ncbi:MAG: A/G-specific adenine glycosylase [Verrucomicrobia bacterium]|nr:MAG: A/G-specific adenine glycosylase [Verrucomicrobiota bacterium]